MTDKQAEERRALVRKIRASRARFLRAHYLEVEERIIPSCATCEFNIDGRCAGAPAAGVETYHRYGHAITDPDDLCILWGASYEAFNRAFARARKPSPPRR